MSVNLQMAKHIVVIVAVSLYISDVTAQPESCMGMSIHLLPFKSRTGAQLLRAMHT